MFQKKIMEKITTQFYSSKLFFFKYRAVCEIMWKNRVVQATDDYMGHALCKLDTQRNTHTFSEYVLVFRCNNGCMNMPIFYVKHTLSVLSLIHSLNLYRRSAGRSI